MHTPCQFFGGTTTTSRFVRTRRVLGHKTRKRGQIDGISTFKFFFDLETRAYRI